MNLCSCLLHYSLGFHVVLSIIDEQMYLPSEVIATTLDVSLPTDIHASRGYLCEALILFRKRRRTGDVWGALQR